MKRSFVRVAVLAAMLGVPVTSGGCLFGIGDDDGPSESKQSKSKRKSAGGTCVGTPTPCSLLSDSQCNWQSNCSRSQASCSGNAHPCETHGAEYCERHPGCSWQTTCAVRLDAPPTCANCVAEKCCAEMVA